MRIHSGKLIICIAAFSLTFAVNANEAEKWSYLGSTGPQHWGSLNSKYAACKNGKAQSPINIPAKDIHGTGSLQIYYRSAPMKIVDDGTTELTLGNKKTFYNDGHSVQLNFSGATPETLSFNGTAYHLVQFHLHTPSENKMNGKKYPLEIHFVNQGKNGEVVVLAVFVDVGAANPTLQAMIDHYPKRQDKLILIKGESINPGALLPKEQAYYTFKGSLTTPPCTEGLQWIVFRQPITASAVQIAELSKAMGEANARPTQPLNGRSVSYSQEASQ